MKLGLVIDLDTCVGCHACAVACKQWNTSGTTGPLTDLEPYGDNPGGVWFNRIRHYEADQYPHNKTVNVPMSCMHCEDADCVTVCPTGASYKREEDGIVLIDQSKCMGCNLCAWACPYGARELDQDQGVMKKCTLCVDRIYDEELPEAERQPACVLTCPTHARFFGDFDDPDSEVSQLVRERSGYAMMPELNYQPVNRYLPPRQSPVAPMAGVPTEQFSARSSDRSSTGASADSSVSGSSEAYENDALADNGMETGNPSANNKSAASLIGKWMQRQKDAFETLGRKGP